MPDVGIYRGERTGRRGPVPKKRIEIAEWVRREIVCGRLGPGDRLPPRSWFQKNFTPNANVVNAAFRELAADGFVETRGAAARGTVVARTPPYAGRYLLLVKAHDEDGGFNFFSSALKMAACELERLRGIKFDAMSVADAVGNGNDSTEYGRVVERVRRHLYSGVFAQHVNREHGLATVLNLDYVPMAYFGSTSEFAQGRWVKGVSGGAESFVAQYSAHFDDCRRAGARRAAVFAPDPARKLAARADSLMRSAAAKHGIDIDENGLHFVPMAHWRRGLAQFERLVRLFLAYAENRGIDAVVLGDDNFLAPFEKVCAEKYGGRPPFRVCCHCNFPCVPKTGLDVSFHGIDCTATLSTFVDYAEALLSGVEKSQAPRHVYV